MSETGWISGPPPEEDGLYSCENEGDFFHLRRRKGLWFSGCKRSNGGDQDEWTKGIIRHYRLPPIPEQPKPPRRFRAKWCGAAEVLGVYFPTIALGNYRYWVLVDGGLHGVRNGDEIRGIEWLDDENGNQIAK